MGLSSSLLLSQAGMHSSSIKAGKKLIGHFERNFFYSMRVRNSMMVKRWDWGVLYCVNIKYYE